MYTTYLYNRIYTVYWGFPHGSVVKESSSNAGAAEDINSIPGSGRSPGGGTVIHSSILAWRIPWREEPSRLQPWGHRKSDTTARLGTYARAKWI